MYKLSIITINYNNTVGLEKTIESVINQTFLDYEFIVIDGGSTDESLRVIKEYSDKINYWVSEPDKGIYDAMNKGILSSKGEFICFLNSGDLFNSIYSIEIVMNLIKSSLSKIFFSDYLFVDENGRKPKIYKTNLIEDRSDFLKYNFGHPSTFYNRDLFTQIGYFDVNNKIVSDVEWYLNAIINFKVEFAHINFVTTIFFDGGISTSSNIIHKTEQNRMINKFFTKNEVKIFSGRSFNYLKNKLLFRKLLSIIFKLNINKNRLNY